MTALFIVTRELAHVVVTERTLAVSERTCACSVFVISRQKRAAIRLTDLLPCDHSLLPRSGVIVAACAVLR